MKSNRSTLLGRGTMTNRIGLNFDSDGVPTGSFTIQTHHVFDGTTGSVDYFGLTINLDSGSPYNGLGTGAIDFETLTGSGDVTQVDAAGTEYQVLVPAQKSPSGPGIVGKPLQSRNDGPFSFTTHVQSITPHGQRKLFGIGQGHRRNLNNMEISRELRTVFSKNGITLSQNATIAIQKSDSQWLIAEGDWKYTIRRTENQLDVYARRTEIEPFFGAMPSMTGTNTNVNLDALVAAPDPLNPSTYLDVTTLGASVIDLFHYPNQDFIQVLDFNGQRLGHLVGHVHSYSFYYLI